jgi:hypothetical protein
MAFTLFNHSTSIRERNISHGTCLQWLVKTLQLENDIGVLLECTKQPDKRISEIKHCCVHVLQGKSCHWRWSEFTHVRSVELCPCSQLSFKTRFYILTPFSFGRLRFEPAATRSFFAELLIITRSTNYILLNS